MSNLKKITRRSFMIGSGLVAGGVAFGTYKVATPHANPLLAELREGEAAFTPFIKITADAVTLITPHTDVGQGVQTAQALLIAEELDIDLDHVTLSFGAPDPAYYNTALADEAVPFQSADDSLAARSARGAAGAAFKMLGLMVTGGSSSVPDSYEKLRMAGAVARETLKKAAADQTGQPLSALQTKQGAVVLPDGTRIAYTDLAKAAADIAPMTDVSLRDPSEWKRLGKPVLRNDIVAKSTGTQRYTIDLELDGMLHASVRSNPKRGGSAEQYDTATAEKMRGISAIVPVTNGIAVVADNTWRAIGAVNAIGCEWPDAPYPAEMADHWQAVSDSFTDDTLDKEWRNDGDVDAALGADAKGVQQIEAEYFAPYVAHQPLEPLCAVARTLETGIEIWTAHQMPRFLQQKVAAVVGCDADEVIFHQQISGGSFGHRLEFDVVTQAAEIAVALEGKPVKLTYSREEDFAQDYVRQISMGRAKGALEDGGVQAWQMDIASPSVTASQMTRLGQPAAGPDTQIAAGVWNMPYAVPHLSVRAYRTPELAPISSWRSVGASSAAFFAESFLDEMIHAAGADPVAERLRLIQSPLHRAVLEAVAEMSDWGAPLGQGRGRGVAFVESFGVPTAEVVQVRDTSRGIVIEKVWVAAEVGQVLDPINFENNVMGGVAWGLGHAMNCEITFTEGVADQRNFDMHDGMRIAQCPHIEVRGLTKGDKVRGIGEPPVPPAAPALANAIFAATGQRVRRMPFWNDIDFA